MTDSTGAHGARGPVFNTVAAFFEQDGWPVTRLEGRTVLQVAVRTDEHQWTAFAQADEARSRFIFYSVAPWPAPEDRRAAFAEFLTRVNRGLVIGNFEMDWADGEIRYKSAIDVTGDRISQALVRQVVYPNVRAMGRHLPAMRALRAGELSAAEAAAAVGVDVVSTGVDNYAEE